MQSAADLESHNRKASSDARRRSPCARVSRDMLIDLGRPDQALKEYESVLAASPNRFNGLHGAAQAAEKSGDSITKPGLITRN